MRCLTAAILVAAGASAMAQEATIPDEKGEKAYRLESGTAVQSIEDTAMTFFRGLAHSVENYPSANVRSAPKDVLRDRDGFNEAEAEELVDLARRLNSFEMSHAVTTDFESSTLQVCSELREAATTERAVGALEADEELAKARNRLVGASVLADLKPSTRTHLIKVLKEFRKDVTVASIEWKKVGPDELAKYTRQRCPQNR